MLHIMLEKNKIWFEPMPESPPFVPRNRVGQLVLEVNHKEDGGVAMRELSLNLNA